MKGIKYVSFYDGGGYDHAARRYIKALMKAGVPLTWQPFVPGKGGRGLAYKPLSGKLRIGGSLSAACNRQIEYDTVVAHIVPEYFPLLISSEKKKKRFVGYTAWETTRIPRHWPDLLNAMDLLMVPCCWNRDVYRACGVKRQIEIVPHVADFGNPTPSETSGPIKNESDFVFYTIGSWTVRKAMPDALRSYLNAFKKEDPALFVVKTGQRNLTMPSILKNFFSTEDAVARLTRSSRKSGRVLLISRKIADTDIAALHARGDCYVSLCRSEGWGLGAFDAACAGKPVIVTGFGGQMDYLPEKLSYHVKYEMRHVLDVTAPKSYSPDQKWAKADIGHASRLMRRVFENQKEAKERGNRLREYIVANFNERKVIELLAKALWRF